jgi:hypothetical protein
MNDRDFRSAYLRDIARTYRNYKTLGERAIAQVSDGDLHTLVDPDANSIAIIVKHLAGNLRSRFRDFLTSDGEKPDRNRDSEFENGPKTRKELLELWENGWKCVFDALEPLTDSDLTRTVTIRSEPHSVMQAINRQVAHCAYHVGQIVYLSKHFAVAKAGAWQSLSVPRGRSTEFTADVAAGRQAQSQNRFAK